MMKRNADDDENPFDDAFSGINEMLPGLVDEAAAVDVHEYKDEIQVIADIPDTSRDEIDIQCDGRVLAIRAARDPRLFRTRVDLATYVDDQSAQVSYNNGVLEVTLDHDTDPANIGFH